VGQTTIIAVEALKTSRLKWFVPVSVRSLLNLRWIKELTLSCPRKFGADLQHDRSFSSRSSNKSKNSREKNLGEITRTKESHKKEIVDQENRNSLNHTVHLACEPRMLYTALHPSSRVTKGFGIIFEPAHPIFQLMQVVRPA